jgi:hypothetical protein
MAGAGGAVVKEVNLMTEAVSCSLHAGDFEERFEAWRGLIASRLLSRESIPEGCVLTLNDGPDVAGTARRLADSEGECCPWMRVEVTGGDVLTIRISSSSPGGPEAIRELFQPR